MSGSIVVASVREYSFSAKCRYTVTSAFSCRVLHSAPVTGFFRHITDFLSALWFLNPDAAAAWIASTVRFTPRCPTLQLWNERISSTVARSGRFELHSCSIRTVRTRHLENQIKSNQIKSNQIKSNQIKSNQIKSNQIRSDQIKSNQIKSNQIKSNQQNFGARHGVISAFVPHEGM